jgi:hypothetical protein
VTRPDGRTTTAGVQRQWSCIVATGSGGKYDSFGLWLLRAGGIDGPDPWQGRVRKCCVIGCSWRRTPAARLACSGAAINVRVPRLMAVDVNPPPPPTPLSTISARRSKICQLSI